MKLGKNVLVFDNKRWTIRKTTQELFAGSAASRLNRLRGYGIEILQRSCHYGLTEPREILPTERTRCNSEIIFGDVHVGYA